MAKIVDSIPGRGINVYPWDEWFDGQARLLEPNVDFKCTPQTIVVLAHKSAIAAGMKAVTRTRPEGVYLQAVKVPTSAEAGDGNSDLGKEA